MEERGPRAGLTCAEVHDAAPQYALDILESDLKAHVAAHLIRCPGCRAEVTQMQESAAELLDLGPDDQPPVAQPAAGPDGLLPAVPARRRRIRVTITVAAAAALMVCSALGPELEQRASRSNQIPAASADLLQAGRQVGGVYFFAGTAPALAIAVRGLAGETRLDCEVTGDDGRVVKLGSLRLYQGAGYWATTTRIDRSHLVSVELIDPQGRMVASTTGS